MSIPTTELAGYFADWCPHCKTAKPKFNEVATKIKQKFNKNNINIVINVYRDEKDKDIMIKRNIQGYPTTEFRIPTDKNKEQVIPFNVRSIPKENYDEFANDIVEIYKKNMKI